MISPDYLPPVPALMFALALCILYVGQRRADRRRGRRHE